MWNREERETRVEKIRFCGKTPRLFREWGRAWSWKQRMSQKILAQGLVLDLTLLLWHLNSEKKQLPPNFLLNFVFYCLDFTSVS